MDQPLSAPATTGYDAFLSLLASEGVEYLFGNPGTTELAIMQAVGAQSAIRYVLGLQEGIVVGMADGYARASGRLAAANVHVAPGLGNAMGSLYSAKFSGSPVLLTAGQQEQGHGLTEPLLYDSLVPIAQPLVKWAVECTRVEDLPRIIRRAAKVALAPPTGPVFLSLPGDVLDATATLEFGQPTRVDFDVRPADHVLEKLASRLFAAQNPVIIAGHELATHNALDVAGEFAELLGAAVLQQTVPYGAHFPSRHRAFVGALNRNQNQVRARLEPHDLLICLGADVLRMSVYSPTDALPAGMPIVQIAERDWELGKNYPTELAVKANVRETLTALNALLKARMSTEQRSRADARLAEIEKNNWATRRSQMVEQALKLADTHPIDPQFMSMCIADAIPDDAVVVDEGLTSTLKLLSYLPLTDHQSYFGLASGGIGFAMSGAIGISIALPDRPVVAIVGDGSAMYSVQALWTAANMKLPITYVIPNNRGYRILKERLVSFRNTDRFVGMDIADPTIDFVGLAKSMGVKSRHVEAPQDFAEVLREAIASGQPNLIDVRVANGFGD
ncbi:MAG: thiamine pyrophosphate-binding protein [Betaproteobacteria bacterium]|nr:MAG: thiamine pyrophosphate-binding protein [Betaproteobacteria bacterium]